MPGVYHVVSHHVVSHHVVSHHVSGSPCFWLHSMECSLGGEGGGKQALCFVPPL